MACSPLEGKWQLHTVAGSGDEGHSDTSFLAINFHPRRLELYFEVLICCLLYTGMFEALREVKVEKYGVRAANAAFCGSIPTAEVTYGSKCASDISSKNPFIPLLLPT